MLPFPYFSIKLTPGQLRAMSVSTLFVILFALSTSSFAQDAGFHLLDTIDGKFAAKAGQWDATIRVYANRLFWMLATADFCFLCATFVLDKKEMDDMLASVIRKLMTLGFFWFVLRTSTQWIPQIIESFTQIGKQAGGATATTPDSVAVSGYSAAMATFQALSDLGTMEKVGAVLPAVFMALLIFLAFLFVAAQLLVCKIETSIAVGAGIILLGFGGSKWTTDMASKYMQYSVATGLKLMLMYLLIGMGQTLFTDLKIIGGDQFFQSLLVTCGSALTYAFLATKIPAIASGMMSGSPSLSAGDMAGAMIGAGAAMAGLGAAGMAAGKAGMGAASGGAAAATGVGKALSAGIASGMDHGKSGAGLAAHAIGQVASHGAGLARAGIGDMLAGGASSFQGRVGESAGGRVATSINAARGGSMAGVAPPAGGGASGASGNSGPSSGGSSSSSSAAPSTSSTDGRSSASASSPADGASGSGAGSASSASEAASAAAGLDSGSQGPQTGLASPAASGAQEAASQASTVSGGSGQPDMSKAAPTAGSTQTQPAGAASTLQPATGAGTSSQAGQRASQAPTQGANPTGAAPASPQPPTPAGNGGDSQPSALAGSAAAQPGNEVPANTSSAAAGAEQPRGDASGGAVTGGKEGKSSNNGSDRKPDPMHKRIQDLQGYIPDDAAQSATLHIDLKHSE
jgi:type IV secretion system protein TrbL